ncbi:hypothetical protein D3C71_1756960 [compost metagenome]
MLHVVEQCRIVWFHRQRKAQVRKCVLMRAADPGRVGQRGQRIQRLLHLRGCAFEQPAAAARKQRVAAKQQRLGAGGAEIGDMACGMAGHVYHLPGAAQQLDLVAALHPGHGLGQGFARRAPDRRAGGRAQCRHATDMIVVVVRD